MSFYAYIAMSLDGYVATPNGDVQWLDPFNGCDYGYEKFIASIDTIVIGRVTYEQSLTFGEWPYKGNRVIVQSSRPLDNLPPDTELWEGTTAELVTHLRERPQGKDVWLIGGPRSIESFAELGVVDVYDVFVMPVLLGAGIPLFQTSARQTRLKLASSETYDNGVVRLVYEPVR